MLEASDKNSTYGTKNLNKSDHIRINKDYMKSPNNNSNAPSPMSRHMSANSQISAFGKSDSSFLLTNQNASGLINHPSGLLNESNLGSQLGQESESVRSVSIATDISRN